MSYSILIFLGIAFGLVLLSRFARFGTVIAFLVAGIIAGPYVMNLWQLTDIWIFLGEIGMVFLWFVLGLEINTKRLWGMRRGIFGFGAAQVLMAAFMFFPILFGITNWTIAGTIMIAMMLAMSSTNADLQVLADRNELQTHMGRQTFSILLFQDLLSIPLLAMLPIFAGKSLNFGAGIIDVVVMTASLIVGVVIVGRLLLNPLMRLVVRLKSKEAFLLAVLGNIFLWAMVFRYLGLPPAIGAFIAGMLLSETMYRVQVQADMRPYQILFLSFFFIALGMGLNLPMLLSDWWIVVLGTIGLIVIKFAAIYMVARVRDISNRESVFIAFVLAQGGEFGLLILQTIKTNGINVIPSGHTDFLTAIIILSMMMTPVLMWIYDVLSRRGKLFANEKVITEIAPDVKPAVVICGFGRVGQTIAQMLEAQRIPYVAIDSSVDAVMNGKEAGFNVYFGDTTNALVLRGVGLAPRYTRAVVIALNNAAVAKRTIRSVWNVSKNARIFARVRNLSEAENLQLEGKLTTLPETIESSFVLGREVLEALGTSDTNIDQMVDSLRKNNYSALGGTTD
ncbi:MAG: cation:proton antiporter [Rickettsiales bacterium]|jgi:glutathione-regulated potassium-efflux system ancillary protein KefC|nr:cation:proton antiporter [Rickettsiales bacterium]